MEVQAAQASNSSAQLLERERERDRGELPFFMGCLGQIAHASMRRGSHAEKLNHGIREPPYDSTASATLTG